MTVDSVWVFVGDGGVHPFGVFASRDDAEVVIAANELSGVLTWYPLGQSVYDYVVEKEFFTPSRPYQEEAKFKQRFSSASLPHEHYIDGRREGGEAS